VVSLSGESVCCCDDAAVEGSIECAVVEGGVAESEPVVAWRREAGVLIVRTVGRKMWRCGNEEDGGYWV